MRHLTAGLFAVAVAAASFTVTRASQGCEFGVSATRIELDTAARSGTVTVTTQPGCAWTVSSSETWLHITTSGGNGSGAIAFTTDAVPPISQGGLAPRQGRLLIRWNTPTAGQDVLVTQDNGTCSALFFPVRGPLSAKTVGWKGGTRGIDTLAEPPFSGPWRVVGAPGWITFFAPPLGVVKRGDGGTAFAADANPSPSPRDGVVTFCNGTTMTVHQAGRLGHTGASVPADFDADGRTDPAVYRPSTGEWWVLGSQSGYAQPFVMQWGTAETVAMPGDFDGDNRTDLAFYNPRDVFGSAPAGGWSFRHSSNGFDPATQTWYPLPNSFEYTPQTRPLMADFNGDGTPDLVRWRPDNAEWGIRLTDGRTPSRLPSSFPGESNTNGYQWGLPGDVPVPADYDGDGLAELAVWRPSNGVWFMRPSSHDYSTAHAAVFQWGLPGDIPIVGDFDADRRTDLCVWRPSDGAWYIVYASTGYSHAVMRRIQWGLAGDVPVSGDYDGDGRTDLAVWRPSNGFWYILFSSQSYSYASPAIFQWGLPGDVPLSARITGAQ